MVGTDIQILQIDEGRLAFKKVKTVPEGIGWSGVINVIKVRAKQTTQTEMEISESMS